MIRRVIVARTLLRLLATATFFALPLPAHARALPSAAGVAAPQPVLLPLVGVQTLAAGGKHTCALTEGGGVLCWGSDEHGQLGDGPADSSGPQPVEALGLNSGVRAIAAGYAHTCALTETGGVLCWGLDDYGQNGSGGDATDKHSPVAVSGLSGGVTAIAAGFNHTCAIVTAAGVRCWGRDSSGQIGDGANNSSKPAPAEVVGLASGVQAIAAGGSHTCALRSGGVYCWGDDTFGQIGDGAGAGSKNVPTPVALLDSGVQALAAGMNHTCALRTTGSVNCWGVDGSGQIGDGEDNFPKYAPEQVPGLTAMTGIAAGQVHSCAIGETGAVCWGSDPAGQLGDGTAGGSANTPAPVAGLGAGLAGIAAGDSHTCVLTAATGAQCWGLNTSGQLADGSTQNRAAPVQVLAPQYRTMLPFVGR